MRSGAFVVEGTGAYRVTAVGEDSFAARITGEARSFRHPRSPLERAVNRLLYALVALVVVLGAVLGYSLYHRHVTVDTAVATSAAGVVTMIPEGLMVLVSLTYAAAAVRMSRRGVLAQQLNAIESLASVDTICVDKTGTLTEAALRVVELVPGAGRGRGDRRRGAGDARRERLGAQSDAAGDRRRLSRPSAEPVLGEVPFSSRRRWSAIQVRLGQLLPGRARAGAGRRARDVAERAPARGPARDRPRRRRRRAAGAAPASCRRTGCGRWAWSSWRRSCGPNVRETVAFLLEQGIEIKVLSGDSPQTVAAIARDVGIPVGGVAEGAAIPEDPRRAAAVRRSMRRSSDASRRRASRRSCRRSGTRAATSRWSATASTTCRR